MDELRAEASDLIAALSEDQLRLVLLYARHLRERDALVVNLEELLEKTA